MPTYRITAPDGKSYDVTAPEGASQDDVLAYAQKSFKMAAAPKEAPSKPFGEQLNQFISDIPRQAGLTARYGAEGVGGVLDVLASPFRAGLNALGANIQGNSGDALANAIGLPKPQTAAERTVGEAARLVAGGALPIAGGASLAARAPLVGAPTVARAGTLAELAPSTGTAANVGRVLSSNPVQQLASAAAAGGAGGYTRETGGNGTSQLLASLGAGLAAPLAISGAQRLVGAGQRAIAGRAAQAPQQIDITINNALQDSGLSLADLPADVARSIRADVSQAMQISPNLADDAVRRLADYRLTGLTPTQASLTLNPSDVTRQKNLAKLGANSRDPAAQQLAEVQNLNNKALIQNLNDIGAANAGDQISGAQRVIGPLEEFLNNQESAVTSAYTTARDTAGRSAALDPSVFTQKAGDLLKEAQREGSLPGDIRRILNSVATGKTPLNVDVAEQIKTRLAEASRDANAQGKGSVAKAVGLVRNALEDTPLLPGQEIGQESIDAFNIGRRLKRELEQVVEKTPALQAIRDGVQPDKFVKDFITSSGPKSNIMDLAQLKNAIRDYPDAQQAVKEQIALYLKNKATRGFADEVANFSQSSYNEGLRIIGDQKLKLFFEPDEIARLKAIGRVASYEQVQPVGSAVNNSNTTGALGGLLERIGASPLLGKIPLGRAAIGEPLQNIVLSQQANRALNAPAALALPGQPAGLPQLGAPSSQLLLSPAALIGTETPEERQRRQQGLLVP